MVYLRNLITDAIKKSKQLLTLSKESKWEQFAKLEAERQTLIKAINFENTVLLEQDYNDFHIQMNELILLNSKLETVCLKQRNIIADKLKGFKRSNTVAQAYSQ
jgi:CRISPR/Cas system CMR-associated protein Cmr3 (group 5 of RAMP superfamily)